MNMIDQLELDQKALLKVLRSATLLSSYLSQGFILSEEERIQVEDAAEKISTAVKDATRDAASIGTGPEGI
jgi:hypothetical protein